MPPPMTVTLVKPCAFPLAAAMSELPDHPADDQPELDWREGAPTPEATVESEEEMIAWRDIWSAGQGVGLVQDVPSVAVLAQRLKGEYAQAMSKIGR